MSIITVPPGFIEIPAEHFVSINGPLYGRVTDGRFVLGFRVEERHCNPRRQCHGGMLMTLADMTAGIGVNVQEKLHRFLPTIKLEGDFIAVAGIGDWLEGTCEVLRTTRNLVFANVLIRNDSQPVMRASTIMKLPAEPDPHFTLHRIFV